MFRVRKEQLERIALTRFIDRVEASLLRHWLARQVFDQDKADIPLRAMIEHGVTVATSYGLETEQELVMFVMRMIELNPQFHEQPHFQRLLRDQTLTFTERSDKMLTEISPDEWRAAARMGDSQAYWSRALATEPEGTKHVEY
jgi:hypothetical protein